MQEQNQQAFRKKIPIPLVLLFIVGAAVLLFFNTTNIQHNPNSYIHPETVEVAIANVPLPAMTPIKSENISVEKVSRDELPKGVLVNAKSVIGRVLAVPVFEGQILTESCFVKEGSAEDLIARIPHGMRAFTVYVSSGSMPDRALLSPGCVVDVLVSYKLSSRDSAEGEALSTTMLREIQVLAVSGDTVISKTEEDQTQKSRSSKTGVTLLVTKDQIWPLSLAQDNGSILLTIRNPNAKKKFDEDPSILNRKKLTPRGTELPSNDLRYDIDGNKPVEHFDEVPSILDKRKVTDSVEAITAKMSLPAGIIITQEHINTKYVSKDNLSLGRLVNPKSVIGRVLAIPVVEGQILTESCFVKEGQYYWPDSFRINPSMRAVTVIVTSKIMPDGALLYPGCVVDVLISYKLSSRDYKGEALSTTMLRGIQVLAVSGEKGGQRSATLLVTARQTEPLSLAQSNGNILLTIRNPNDKRDILEKNGV